MLKNYFTVEQIARILGMHPKTIQRYIREGKLKATKIGKSWRVSGHDLSRFTEGDAPVSEEPAGRNEEIPVRARVSSVADIEAGTRGRAIQIVNSLTAMMNGKPADAGECTMHTQILDSEALVRVTLWGDITTVVTILRSIEAYTIRS